MNNYLTSLKQKILSGHFKNTRKPALDKKYIINKCEHLSQYESCYEVIHYYLENEEPIIIQNSNFVFINSFEYKLYPMILSGKDMKLTHNGYPINGSFVKNMSPNWKNFIDKGIHGIINDIDKKISNQKIQCDQLSYLENTRKILLDITSIQHRYLKCAIQKKQMQLVKTLSRVPYERPSSFHEALQAIYFMFNMIRISQSNHIGFHRIDQYLFKLYENDINNNVLTRKKALELIEEFFLMLNIDTDLYSAIQPGDSGMTLMLGGKDKFNNDVSNELTELFMQASIEVGMIEPKINLRVHANTPDRILDIASRLTKKGLGYPQYCNDDIVIPSLMKFGYDEDDAYDYTVAACWEFVVKNGLDTPNVLYLDMPLAVDACIRRALKHNQSFQYILDSIPYEFEKLIKRQFKSKKTKTTIPNLLVSALEPVCIENMIDSMHIDKWHYNYGCHGVGSSTAVDSLVNVKKYVYELKTISKISLLKALETNFDNDKQMHKLLNSNSHKLCSDNKEANSMLHYIFKCFADVLKKLKLNGKRIRPGSGSAHFYAQITQGEDPELKATADGRRMNDYISSSLAPSPNSKALGILSIFNSYRCIDYNEICNGGPITIEISSDVFNYGSTKYIEIIKSFIRSGCQQLQINLLNRNDLIDAQIHPERHKNLIVRVWGWSGYFVQLDRKFQNQIIQRAVYR